MRISVAMIAVGKSGTDTHYRSVRFIAARLQRNIVSSAQRINTEFRVICSRGVRDLMISSMTYRKRCAFCAMFGL